MTPSFLLSGLDILKEDAPAMASQPKVFVSMTSSIGWGHDIAIFDCVDLTSSGFTEFSCDDFSFFRETSFFATILQQYARIVLSNHINRINFHT
jgi:hypothetical protein